MQDENEKAVRTLFEQWWNDNCADKPIVDYGYQTLTQDIAYHAFKAALQSQVSNTDGWVMVPVEPTQEMIDAGIEEMIRIDAPEPIYKAMLSAAQKAKP
jgi:chorismate mutase